MTYFLCVNILNNLCEEGSTHLRALVVLHPSPKSHHVGLFCIVRNFTGRGVLHLEI